MQRSKKRRSKAPSKKIAGKPKPKVATARRVSFAIRADGEDALALSFDRKLLSSVFGAKKRSKASDNVADFAQGIRMAVQMAAPALLGALPPSAPQVIQSATPEELHARNEALAHEFFRQAGFKVCPFCGSGMEPS